MSKNKQKKAKNTREDIIFNPFEDDGLLPDIDGDMPSFKELTFAHYYNFMKEEYSSFKIVADREATLAGESEYVGFNDMNLSLIMPDNLTDLDSLELDVNTILRCQINKDTDGYYAVMVNPEHRSIQLLNNEAIHFRFYSDGKKLFPFLEYCVKNHIVCNMIGYISHNYTSFEISDIIMLDSFDNHSLQKNNYVEDGIIQPVKRKVFRKLLSGDVNIYDREYESIAECSMILHFFREYYPDDVVTVITKALRDQSKKHVTASTKRQELSTALGLINVDWRFHNVPYPSISEIREMLDREYYGMENVKRRILSILGRLRRCDTIPKWGILLQGPPGVGKTSVVQFIASLLHRPVIYLDPSSTQDHVGIMGSSKVYDNGQPGTIFREIMGQRTAQQTMIINEIDKMDSKGQSTLLSLLDRKGYTDANIDYPIALTGLTFIATCNDLSSLSETIKDRFEIIELSPYSSEEKQHIFADYLFPSLLRRAGLSPSEVCIDPKATETLCKFYSNDYGVRDLEKYGERIIDDYLLSLDIGAPVVHCYDMEKVAEILGPSKCPVVHVINTPGMVRSVTVKDGKVLGNIVEAKVVPGNGTIKIIGAPGKFTEDHIAAACHYARSLGLFSAEKTDILVRLQSPGFDSTQNTLGLAALCAVLSDVHGTVFDFSFAVIGGVTLHGGLYYSGADMDSILTHCEDNDISKIYCPVGCSDRLTANHKNISLIEAYDVSSLLAITDLSA